jgi:biopolymer transport protein TolQ
VTADASFLQLILTTSVVVKFVMALLLLISITSWWVIFKKYFSLSRVRAAANDFEDTFWSGVDLNSLYSRLDRQKQVTNGMAAIFMAGFREFLRLRSQPQADAELLLSGSQRAMRAAMTRELDELETYLPLLATTGSVSPYIGLFGTVWGIMNSFRALGAAQQATLAQVAPGIAEALIATAIGLFAAIPAVVAYNRYTNQVDRLVNRYDTFMEEFSNILHRQSYNLRKAATALESP